MKFFNQIAMTMFVKKNKLKLKTLHFFQTQKQPICDTEYN